VEGIRMANVGKSVGEVNRELLEALEDFLAVYKGFSKLPEDTIGRATAIRAARAIRRARGIVGRHVDEE